MMTSLRTLRRRDVREAVVAVPTAPVSAINLVRPYANRIICLNIRSGPIFAVADAYKAWYDRTDGEVVEIIERKDEMVLIALDIEILSLVIDQRWGLEPGWKRMGTTAHKWIPRNNLYIYGEEECPLRV